MFKKSLALIMLFTSPSILATGNPHRLGLSYGIGSIESDLNHVDPTLSLTEIVYEYQVSPEWVLRE